MNNSNIDWEKYRWAPQIECTFLPRETCEGMKLKPGFKKMSGKILLLSVLWKMDSEDQYPGEYALGAADKNTEDLFRRLNIRWIASGDVTPVILHNTTALPK